MLFNLIAVQLLSLLLWMICCAPLAAADAPLRQAAPSPTPPPAPLRSQLDSEPIGPRGGNSSPGSSAVPHTQGLELPRMAGALAIVLALIFVLRFGIKRMFGHASDARSTRAISVLARAPLAPRQHVVLLRVGRRVLVIGDSGSQMNPLCEITDADEIASLLGQLQSEKTALPARSFSAWFNRARRDMEGGDEPRQAEDAQTPVSAAPAAASAGSEEDVAISNTREEISGLMDKLRSLSTQYRNERA